MKKLLALLLLLVSASAYSQGVVYVPVNCAPSTPCTISGPANTKTGDAWYVFAGKYNAFVPGLAIKIAAGTSALGTSAIPSGSCATVVSTAATGVLGFDSINWSFSADPTSTVGYTPTSLGMLTIISWPTPNTVNWKVCNTTAASVTPGAVTLNWQVTR